MTVRELIYKLKEFPYVYKNKEISITIPETGNWTYLVKEEDNLLRVIPIQSTNFKSENDFIFDVEEFLDKYKITL